jgi:hypothetical protein
LVYNAAARPDVVPLLPPMWGQGLPLEGAVGLEGVVALDPGMVVGVGVAALEMAVLAPKPTPAAPPTMVRPRSTLANRLFILGSLRWVGGRLDRLGRRHAITRISEPAVTQLEVFSEKRSSQNWE